MGKNRKRVRGDNREGDGEKVILTEADVVRFRGGMDIRGEDDCWFWLRSCDPQGYGQFQLNGRCERVHRVSWFLENGQIPEFFEGSCSEICHSCDNPPCCNPRHLFLGNSRINNQDSAVKGRKSYFQPWRKGELNSCALKTEIEVKDIKQLLREGILNQGEIGVIFGVSSQTINQISTGRRWSHVLI